MPGLGFGYRRDGERIFWKDEQVKKADAGTFTVLNATWARDARRVYVVGRERQKADVASFRVLDRIFAKDDHLVWFLSGAVTDADAATFESLGPGTTHAFGRDARSVFHHTGTIGKPRALRGVDPAAFGRIGESFGSDGRRVYYESYLLPGAKAASWRPLNAFFSTDGKRVFYASTPIEGADAGTFEVLPGDGGWWARDRGNYYEHFRIADRQQYHDHLRGLSILHGIARRAYYADGTGQPLPPGTPIDLEQRHHVRIEVECQQWLRRSHPAAGANLSPGATLTIGQYYLWITPDEWRDRSWLWLLKFDEKDPQPPRYGLSPILNWQDCMPDTARPLVESVLAELER